MAPHGLSFVSKWESGSPDTNELSTKPKVFRPFVGPQDTVGAVSVADRGKQYLKGKMERVRVLYPIFD